MAKARSSKPEKASIPAALGAANMKRDMQRAERDRAMFEVQRNAAQAANEVLSAVAYRAQETGSRLRRRARMRRGSPDAIASPSARVSLVEQAREFDRDDLSAQSIINRAVDLTIGSGLLPLPMSDDEEWNRQALEVFEEASEDCTHDGEDNFRDLQISAYRETLVDGDHLVLKLHSGKLQQVDGLRIASPWVAGAPGTSGGVDGPMAVGNIMRDGVESDPTGARVAYWVADWEPRTGMTLTKPARVPAPAALYLSRRKPSGQTRGMPTLAPAIIRLEQLDTFIEATQTAALVHAMMAFVHKTAHPKGAAGLLGSSTETGSDGLVKQLQDFQPGMLLTMKGDDEFDAVQSTQPGTQFEPFTKMMIRLCANVANLPLELAILDFTGLSWSASRSIMQFVGERLKAERMRFANQFCTPVYRWWIGGAIAEGRLPAVNGWGRVRWSEPSLGWFNPLQEVTADKIAMENNLKSYQEIQSGYGKDWRRTLQQNAEARREMERLNVMPALAPGGVGLGGAADPTIGVDERLADSNTGGVARDGSPGVSSGARTTPRAASTGRPTGAPPCPSRRHPSRASSTTGPKSASASASARSSRTRRSSRTSTTTGA